MHIVEFSDPKHVGPQIANRDEETPETDIYNKSPKEREEQNFKRRLSIRRD